MKIALYIEDGLEQVVLTPESETEKAILGKLNERPSDFAIKSGQFFRCQGGYVHQQSGPRSTMIVLTEATPKATSVSLKGLADVVRAEIENAVPRFLGDDPRAREIAESWRDQIAEDVSRIMLGNAA